KLATEETPSPPSDHICFKKERACFPLSWAGHYPQVVLLHTGAVLSAREDRCFGVPQGQSRIARRFNAGLDAERSRVPKGRLRSNPTTSPSAVPSGLFWHARCFPALKRRAILKMSLGDKGIWWPPFPARKQPDSRTMPSSRFRGCGVRPRRCGTRSRLRCPARKMWDVFSPRRGRSARSFREFSGRLVW